MPFIDIIPSNATPGERTCALATQMGGHFAAWRAGNANLKGGELVLYQTLSNLQCWDAAMYCAWMAKGINCPEFSSNPKGLYHIINKNNWDNLFGNAPLVARNAGEMRAMPDGCFVGFELGGELRHVMLHIGNGMGTGNKNDCVFRNSHTIGYETVDMTAFFGADSGFNNNGASRVIYKAVTGQTINVNPNL